VWQPTGQLVRAYFVNLDQGMKVLDPGGVAFFDVILTANGVTVHRGGLSCPTTQDKQGCGAAFVVSGAAACLQGCTSITVQFVSPGNEPHWYYSFDGSQLYPTWRTNTAVISTLPGQDFIKDYQKVPIVLHPDPKFK